MTVSKNIVVVGGTRGIGRDIVRRRIEAGDSVTVLSRSDAGLEELAAGLVQHISCDVTTDDVDSITLSDRVDGLVYCPGSINLRSFTSLKPQQFRDDFELNVLGAVRCIQAASKALKASSAASIVLFSTVAVQQGMFAHASIAAAKGAIEGLTRTLAAELAPSVRVNCLAPALTETSLTERFFSTPDKAAALAEKYPMGRTGKPSDLGAMASFLLSDESSWMTGQVIGVDGGMSSLRR
ncbi:MAG: SDR family NAD(P)-dependent oxidoreductase [Aureliella sp.]